jgi:hypothetical protein
MVFIFAQVDTSGKKNAPEGCGVGEKFSKVQVLDQLFEKVLEGSSS